MTSQFLIFISLVSAIYFSANAYVFWRGWVALAQLPGLRAILAVTYVVSALAYIAGRIAEGRMPRQVSDAIIWYGSLWLGVLTYLFFLALGADLVRGVLRATHTPLLAGPLTASLVAGLSILIVAIGVLNARMPVVRTLTYNIPKDGGTHAVWHIVAVSDIHLGTLIDRSRAQALVASIKALHPDLVLLVGDVVDEDLAPVVRGDIGNVLREIDAPYGTYAVPGNHEYIGGIDTALAYLNAHEITILRDRAVAVGDSLYLAGRDDISGIRFGGHARAPLRHMLADVPHDAPVVLLDHQPVAIDEADATHQIDLMLSGHTHNGQLWPFDLITRAVFERSTGALQKDSMHVYVSSGWGTWGPPVRTTARPELLDITLHLTGAPEQTAQDRDART